MPDKVITPDSALRAIRRRLEQAELEHLRRFVDQQGERIEVLEHELQNAHSEADSWRRDLFELSAEIAENCDLQVGMTKDGAIGLIDRKEALIAKLASLNPDAGEIGEGMLAYLVGEARIIRGEV